VRGFVGAQEERARLEEPMKSQGSESGSAQVRTTPAAEVRANRDRLIYSIRIDHPEHGVQELCRGADLDLEIAAAKEYHAQHGVKTWVVNLKTGRRAWRSDATKGAARERRGL
jgi:hypothetical protein